MQNMLLQTCYNAKKIWKQIHSVMQKIFKDRHTNEIRDFFVGTDDKQLEKSNGTLCLYTTTAARLLYAQNWKTAQWRNG